MGWGGGEGGGGEEEKERVGRRRREWGIKIGKEREEKERAYGMRKVYATLLNMGNYCCTTMSHYWDMSVKYK